MDRIVYIQVGNCAYDWIETSCRVSFSIWKTNGFNIAIMVADKIITEETQVYQHKEISGEGKCESLND